MKQYKTSIFLCYLSQNVNIKLYTFIFFDILCVHVQKKGCIVKIIKKALVLETI